MRKHLKTYCSFFFILLILNGCFDLKNKRTTIVIEDNHRHYYPILRGHELTMEFTIKNTGKNTLILSDIITSCGCITIDKSTVEMIPAGKEGKLIVKYDSNKNVGYVQHFISLYGNFTTSDMKEIIFDVNVVPESLNTKDYEEIYIQEARKKKKDRFKNFMEHRITSKTYYTDNPLE